MERTRFPQEQLTNEIVQLHDEITHSLRTSLEKAIRIGELLAGQRQALKHGEWLPWVKEHMPFTDQTARTYMKFHLNKDYLKFKKPLNLEEAYNLLLPKSGTTNTGEHQVVRVSVPSGKITILGGDSGDGGDAPSEPLTIEERVEKRGKEEQEQTDKKQRDYIYRTDHMLHNALDHVQYILQGDVVSVTDGDFSSLKGINMSMQRAVRMASEFGINAPAIWKTFRCDGKQSEHLKTPIKNMLPEANIIEDTEPKKKMKRNK